MLQASGISLDAKFEQTGFFENWTNDEQEEKIFEKISNEIKNVNC